MSIFKISLSEFNAIVKEFPLTICQNLVILFLSDSESFLESL